MKLVEAACRPRAPGAVRLTADSESLTADGQYLAFVRIELADADGIVSVKVTGAASLAALGTAAPATTEDLSALERTTYYGRALLVLK